MLCKTSNKLFIGLRRGLLEIIAREKGDNMDMCLNCGIADMARPLFIEINDSGIIEQKMACCSEKCAIEYAKARGVTYDFDCECNLLDYLGDHSHDHMD